MEITKFNLEDVYLINLKPIMDERGFFMRVYDDELMGKNNINKKWVQENHSLSKLKGTIRGLHLQLQPYCESKLIRCIRGSILDVFVDLRLNSKTFGKWDSVVLSEENKKMILVPRGFAHGFCTLSDNTEVLYKVDNIYKPEYEVGIIWNDFDLNINWNFENPKLSEKDKNNISLKEFITKYKGIEV